MDPLLEKVVIITPGQQMQPVADDESESVLIITLVSYTEMGLSCSKDSSVSFELQQQYTETSVVKVQWKNLVFMLRMLYLN